MQRWLFVTALTLGCGGCGLSIDRPMAVSGDHPGRSHHSVEGAIHVAADTHTGALSSIAGTIDLDHGATAQSAKSVTGGIGLHGATVLGKVQTVTGAVRADTGSRIGGDLTATVAEISLEGTDVGGRVEAVSGSIVLTGHTLVRGGIALLPLQPDEKNPDVLRLPKLVLGPDVRVQGPITAARGGTILAAPGASFQMPRNMTLVRGP